MNAQDGYRWPHWAYWIILALCALSAVYNFEAYIHGWWGPVHLLRAILMTLAGAWCVFRIMTYPEKE
jgi:hypothetical protein